MENEKMIILQMISDGKISADDGVKLIKAFNSSTGDSGFSEKLSHGKEKFKSAVKGAEPKMRKTVHNITGNVSGLARNVSTTFKSFFDVKKPEEPYKSSNIDDDNIIDSSNIVSDDNK